MRRVTVAGRVQASSVGVKNVESFSRAPPYVYDYARNGWRRNTSVLAPDNRICSNQKDCRFKALGG